MSSEEYDVVPLFLKLSTLSRTCVVMYKRNFETLTFLNSYNVKSFVNGLRIFGLSLMFMFLLRAPEGVKEGRGYTRRVIT